MSSMSTTPTYGQNHGYPVAGSDSPTRPVAIDPTLFRTDQPVPSVPSMPSGQPVQNVQLAQPVQPASPVAAYRTGIDHVRFWVGAGLAAAIAAMAALVGLLLIGGILQISVPVSVGAYAMIAAAIVIGASALYNLMLHIAPHPTTYYGALAAVVICLAVLLPFTVPMALFSQIAFAGLNLVVGLMIAFMVPMAVVAARR